MAKRRVGADRMNDLCTLAMLFVGGGIAGWIYEMLFYRINDGMFVRRGQGLGPWLPIYAFGSVFIWLLADRFRERRHGVPIIFLISAATSGILEFVTGWVLYHLFGGLRLWDYNTEIWNWGNIGGYVCLRSVLLFAFAGVGLVCFAAPFIRQLSRRLPPMVFYLISLAPAALFLADIAAGYLLKAW